jgi:hypothetical protein
MYDELWAEHLKLSTGKIFKPFKDRHKFGTHSLKEGFMSVKPDQFYELDYLFVKCNQDNYLVTLADNRMMMGDYRYGVITRQNLDNYDTEQEFFRRLKVAKETQNLEYIVDAYNMLRIEYYKKKNINQIKDLLKHRFYILLEKAIKEEWKLTSIDDGIHAIEK